MKQLILCVFVLCSASAFSQKKLAVDKIMKDSRPYFPFIYDDGNFIIYEQQLGNIYADCAVNSYDGDGNVLLKRKIEDPGGISAYMNKGKCWISVVTGGSKITIKQSDIAGNVTETELKDKAFKYQKEFVLINEDGNAEIYLKHIRANYKMEKDMIPYLMVEYDPILKTAKLNNFLTIPNIKGEVRFIGRKDGETYFVNWNKTEKDKYNFKILSLDKQNQLKTHPGIDFVSERRMLFAGGDMVIHDNPMHEYNSIYFVINDFGGGEERKTMYCNYYIYKFDGKEISKTFFKVPLQTNAITNTETIPLNCLPEYKGNSVFYMRDASGSGLIFETDFSSQEVKPQIEKVPKAGSIVFYQEEFPNLYAEAMKYTSGKSVFKICDDGFARLVVVTKEGDCLLFTEEIPR